MKEFSLPMALTDYLPVILFCLASLTLIKDLKNKMNRLSFLLFSAGAFLVAAAGFLKASYKLLYALRIGDFIWKFPSLETSFPVITLHFLAGLVFLGEVLCNFLVAFPIDIAVFRFVFLVVFLILDGDIPLCLGLGPVSPLLARLGLVKVEVERGLVAVLRELNITFYRLDSTVQFVGIVCNFLDSLIVVLPVSRFHAVANNWLELLRAFL